MNLPNRLLTDETEGAGFQIETKINACLNYASWQNSVPLLQSLAIASRFSQEKNDLRLTVRSEPAFLRTKTWHLDRLQPNSLLAIPERQIELDPGYLNGLNEAERGEVRFELHSGDELLASHCDEIRILARDEWGGFWNMSELLAAFVMPNDPAIARILKAAGEILASADYSPSMNGYQSRDPRRSFMLAAAIWSAIGAEGLTYANPPRSFELHGQKTRRPGVILQQGLATCLDSSLLFASSLEAAGLNPIVVVVDGHAFAGVWLKERTFGNLIEPDPSEVRKAISAHELVVFETTLITGRPPATFDEAIAAAQHHLREDAIDQFVGVLDITRARMAQIRPLASHEATEFQPVSTVTNFVIPLPACPSFAQMPEEIVEVATLTPQGRVDRWQRRLLDLSLRNRLLNFRDTKQTVPFLCPDISLLEDELAGQNSLKVISLTKHNPLAERDKELYFQQTKQDFDQEFVKLALSRQEIVCPLTQADMDHRLTALYRSARNDLSEGGSNTLFLAVGFLKWKKTADDKKTYRAPLLLIPVKLERSSALSPFRLKHHEDDVRFNFTLLQLLKKDYGRSISAFEGDLPRDEHGVDVARVLDRMRKEVREIPGFEVVDETALSTFSFAKYLMWKDLVDRTGQLEENRVVRHLIRDPHKAFQSAVGQMAPTEREIDRCYIPSQLIHPLAADSSQLAAIMSASEGHDFVLIGPPGTGKSQTIANMIAQCLANRKTVLFVAEKTAALDVVHRRLCQHGLGDLCLELHSNKAERSQFFKQLGVSWDAACQKLGSPWLELNDRLRIRRDELNDYVESLHQVDASGWSIFRAMSVAVQGRHEAAPTLEWKDSVQLDAARYQAFLSIIRSLELTYQTLRPCPALFDIRATTWSSAWEGHLLNAAAQVRKTGVVLQAVFQEFAATVGLTAAPDSTLESLEQWDSLARTLIESSQENFRIIFTKDFAKLSRHADSLSRAIELVQTTRQKLSASYGEMASQATIPLDELDLQWRKAKAQFWPLSLFAKRHVQKLLQSYADSGQADPENDLPLLRVLSEAEATIACHPYAGLLPQWSGVETNVAEVLRYLERAGRVRQEIMDFGKAFGALSEISSRLSAAVIDDTGQHPVVQQARRFLTASQACREAMTVFESLAGNQQTPEESPRSVEKTLTLAQGVQESKSELKRWTAWNEIRERALQNGLESLVEALETQTISPDRLSRAFEMAFVRWWLPRAIDRSPLLCRFQSLHHEDAIQDFRRLDELAREEAARYVKRQMSRDLPRKEEVPRQSELGRLRHQMGLQRPSKTIREVITSMPESFSQLAPCLLMSPLSIAQYLPAQQPLFDVVIFDEASQITTWDAIGAIARGRQTIIVGDPKQLPPSNFFGRVAAEDDEDIDDYEQDLESILDEATASGLPVKRLDWHYRSRHESLIAFSNWNYYDNRLITFPSPFTQDRAVSLKHLPDAIYDRGKSKTNQREAESLVANAVARMKAWITEPEEKRLTLGIITFNSQQQTLIQDLLDAALRESPELEWFFSDERIEPTMVKNLENVQGDERDVILFSVTYGPHAATRSQGIPGLNFGPLNRLGGERRLNVAITRARHELAVYVSFLPDQLPAEKVKHQGVRDLKAFLKYASGQGLELASDPHESQGGFESPFEEAVATALAEKGWQFVPQVGVSVFRVDLAIVHPDLPGRFLAAVECDGATYHRSATARDRDLIREGILRNLGWEVVRVWSPDWWYDPADALETAHGELQAILEKSRQAASIVGDEGGHEEEIVVEVDYHLTTGILPIQGNAEQFFEDSYRENLQSMIVAIIATEAPLREETLVQAIARHHGWKRASRRIREHVLSFIAAAQITEESSGRFIWPEEGPQERIAYRPPRLEEDRRSLGEIPLAELVGFVLERNELLAKPDASTTLARELGVGRITQQARERMTEAIEKARTLRNTVS